MTKSELSKYKNLLEAKQTDLTHLVRNREGIVIKTSPDALDEVQHASEREMAIGNLVRDSNLLRNVRRALRDIEEDSFGVCLHCEEDITPNDWRQSRGHRFAFSARKSPTGAKARAPTASTSCWSAPPKRETLG